MGQRLFEILDLYVTKLEAEELKLEADHETLTPIIIIAIIAITDGAPSDDLERTIRVMAEDSIKSMPSRGRLGFVFSRSATIQARLRLFSV